MINAFEEKFLCTWWHVHVVASSFLLLREHKLGLHMMKNFSVRHTLHATVGTNHAPCPQNG